MKEKGNEAQMRKEDPSEDDIFNPGKVGKNEEEKTEGGEDDIYDQPGVVNDDLYLEDEVELDEGYDLGGEKTR